MVFKKEIYWEGFDEMGKLLFDVLPISRGYYTCSKGARENVNHDWVTEKQEDGDATGRFGQTTAGCC